MVFRAFEDRADLAGYHGALTRTKWDLSEPSCMLWQRLLGLPDIYGMPFRGRIDKWQLLDLLKSIGQPPENEQEDLDETSRIASCSRKSIRGCSVAFLEVSARCKCFVTSSGCYPGVWDMQIERVRHQREPVATPCCETIYPTGPIRAPREKGILTASSCPCSSGIGSRSGIQRATA